ncbi:MAG: HD-GYP domain-containing protein [Fimbriimonadales bacterium]|nr:HD-GYP domain-containing protein [Fimbriimonadales bacterium]CUU37379.1 HDIG domain-containing protein [Armatimonadetes bacterium GXS]
MRKRRFWYWIGLTSLPAGVILLAASDSLSRVPEIETLFWLMLVALVAELFLVRYPLRYGYTDHGIWMSVSTPIVIATLVLYGWEAGVWMDAVITLVAGLANTLFRSTYPRWAFLNTVQSVLSAFCAGMVVTGVDWLIARESAWHFVLATGGALMTYHLVNSLLISTNIALFEGVQWGWAIRQNLSAFPQEATVMLLFSLIVGLLVKTFGVSGLVMALAPYLTLRQAFMLWTRQHDLYHQTIRSLGFLVQKAHPYTGGHLQRVAQWARKVAQQLGLPPERCELVYEAALLHDLGKTVLDERILNKPGRLTSSEWKQIKRHPQLGAEILGGTPFLAPVVPWIAYHHERPDGKGYPYGLKGDQIPLEARIIAVVDAFDAMIGGETPSQQRSYRKALSIEEALQELKRGAGSQFDPTVVGIFESVVREWQRYQQIARGGAAR